MARTQPRFFHSAPWVTRDRKLMEEFKRSWSMPHRRHSCSLNTWVRMEATLPQALISRFCLCLAVSGFPLPRCHYFKMWVIKNHCDSAQRQAVAKNSQRAVIISVRVSHNTKIIFSTSQLYPERENTLIQAWWHTPVTSGHGRRRQRQRNH